MELLGLISLVRLFCSYRVADILWYLPWHFSKKNILKLCDSFFCVNVISKIYLIFWPQNYNINYLCDSNITFKNIYFAIIWKWKFDYADGKGGIHFFQLHRFSYFSIIIICNFSSELGHFLVTEGDKQHLLRLWSHTHTHTHTHKVLRHCLQTHIQRTLSTCISKALRKASYFS